MTTMQSKLTFRDYLDKVIRHKIRVRTAVVDGRIIYHASIRNTDKFCHADDPIIAVSQLLEEQNIPS